MIFTGIQHHNSHAKTALNFINYIKLLNY